MPEIHEMKNLKSMLARTSSNPCHKSVTSNRFSFLSVRMYGRDYGARLASVGFEVLADDFIQSLPLERVRRHALPKEEIIYKVVKPA